MSDNEKELHLKPVSADDPPVGSEEEKQDARFANNYAMAIALGLPAGLLLGLLVLDNIALGLLIGAGLAPIVAAVMGNLKSVK